MSTNNSSLDLSKRAMLVDLTIRQWAARKNDHAVAQEVATNHGSDVHMGRYHKNLLAKKALVKIRKVLMDARNEHYKRTVAYGDNGKRILTSDGFFEYSEKMRGFQRELDPALDELETNYPDFKAEAKASLNGLYNEADYPSIKALRRKFALEFEVEPIPRPEHLLVDLGAQMETERLQREIEETVNRKVAEGMKGVWERMRDVVTKMAERLRAYSVTETGVENGFKNSLVGNIEELIGILPSLNVTQDPDMDAFAQRMKADLCAIHPDTLRSDDALRNQVATAAEDILAKMEAFI